jgi:hypothetical protein
MSAVPVKLRIAKTLRLVITEEMIDLYARGVEIIEAGDDEEGESVAGRARFDRSNSKAVTMLIGQLVNDIVRFKRAAAGQSNAQGCRTRYSISSWAIAALVPFGIARSRPSPADDAIDPVDHGGLLQLRQVPAEPLDLGGDLVAVAVFEDAPGQLIGDGQPHRDPLNICLTDVRHARPH